MEQEIIAGDSVSSPQNPAGQEAVSRRKSKRGSKRGQVAADTTPAESRQSDCEIELSILQTALDRYIETGGKTQTMQVQLDCVAIYLWDVTQCPKCCILTLGSQCPVCKK